MDETIEPPHPKMVACVECDLGFFFRVNSRPNWQTSLPISKAMHPFLDHDSYLECGCPLELDEYVIEESIRLKGVAGQIDSSLIAAILAIVEGEKLLNRADKDAIRRFLGASSSGGNA